ncbi:MAG: carboxypeptidase M32 [Chlamydiales bacterium]|nr:carboxypeptidase M32 [Chlamydiales bacterium]
MHPAYQRLMEISEEARLLQSLDYLLMWDSETYMPKKGISFRSSQKEYIAKLQHHLLTSKELSSIFKQLIDFQTKEVLIKDLSEDQQIAVLRCFEDYEKEIKLPSSLVEEIAKVAAESSHVWSKAKQENDFAAFLPYLEKTFDLMRKKADCLGFTDHPYDALIDLYEPKMTVQQLDKLFGTIKQPIQDLVANRKNINDDCLKGNFDVEKQKKISHELLLKMGYDKDAYRLDLSSHPFCFGFCQDDIRMTTRINPSNFADNISTILHEAGHGLYEANIENTTLPIPLRRYLSIAMHESQSKFWECFVGLNKNFWQGFYPTVKQEFPSLSHLSLDTLYQAVNKIEPSFIRVHADEVTYCLHIILRYEIEKGFIEGSLKPKDLPDIWREKMKQYLGIVPPTDKEGCLQDIHFAAGYVGYFPTYALGCFYAAQFFNQLKKDHPDYSKKMQHHDLLFMKQWLTKHVHSEGRKYYSHELLQKVTKEGISSRHFLHYLNEKYNG